MLFTAFEDVSVAVRPQWKLPRCGRCGRRAPGYDRCSLRHWRHLCLGKTRMMLTYAPRRVQCPLCGVRVESIPWADGGSRFTWAFEEMVAYLAQITDKTKVTELTGIAWATVGSIVARVVSRRLDPDRLKGLRSIGVDEFSYRKRHRYLTIVVDHERRRVIWAGEGRSAEVLGQFFEQLGEQGRAAIETVTIDMAAGYRKAIREWLPNAQIVYDRFHVQRLASDAVDEVRREMVRVAEGSDEARAIKNTRYALLKNPWNLTNLEHSKLAQIQDANKPLYRAYLLKETLAQALDYSQPWRARDALRRWTAWASRSKLKPFVKLARTIRRHFEGIIAYVRTRLTNGLVEGINNKLRMVARRAFGFHSADALAGMLFLVCGGIRLDPPIPTRS
ncbi:MAG: ISL3 family transposase [Thermoanaerobaculia bacterium]|nr:ISL3 family transposase [Thermoanaerobaculia bacterium]